MAPLPPLGPWTQFKRNTLFSATDALAKLLERVSGGDVVIYERINGGEVRDGDEIMVLGTAHREMRHIDGLDRSTIYLTGGLPKSRNLGPWLLGENRIWTWGRPLGTWSAQTPIRRVLWRRVTRP